MNQIHGVEQLLYVSGYLSVQYSGEITNPITGGALRHKGLCQEEIRMQ